MTRTYRPNHLKNFHIPMSSSSEYPPSPSSSSWPQRLSPSVPGHSKGKTRSETYSSFTVQRPIAWSNKSTANIAFLGCSVLHEFCLSTDTCYASDREFVNSSQTGTVLSVGISHCRYEVRKPKYLNS